MCLPAYLRGHAILGGPFPDVGDLLSVANPFAWMRIFFCSLEGVPLWLPVCLDGKGWDE